MSCWLLEHLLGVLSREASSKPLAPRFVRGAGVGADIMCLWIGVTAVHGQAHLNLI